MADREYNRIKKGRIFIYFYLILLLFLMLTVASYTWFSLSLTPRVSQLSLYVTTLQGMEVSLTPEDEESWSQQVSFPDMVSVTAPLKPATWSDGENIFYAAEYGIDGRMTGDFTPLSDERNANQSNNEGYYCKGTFYARTMENVTVKLATALELDEGQSGTGTYVIGVPVWDSEKISHTNMGYGAENAVRIGLRVTHLDSNLQPQDKEPVFFIYEPNCTSHIDYSNGYVNTPSINGEETLVPSDRLITQTATVWQESYPVQNGVQVYSFGSFTSETKLFELKKDEYVKIELYFWLEGQDIDCTNEIEEAQLFASVQFLAQTGGQSGLDPIPGEDEGEETGNDTEKID